MTAALLAAPGARAAPPCGSTGPYVLVTSGPSPAGFDVAAMVDRLAVELSGRGIALCTRRSTTGSKPIAVVRLGPGEPAAEGAPRPTAAIALDIEVRDAVTEKRVGREIDLGSVPRDGRAVVVALAADELLRASWAELALDRAPRPHVALPPAVRAAIAPAAPTRPWLSLGVRGVAEGWSGGLALFGADAEATARLTDRLSLSLSAGARLSPDVAAPDGAVSARALTLRLGPALTLTPPERAVALAWTFAPVLYVVDLEGHAVPPAAGASSARAAFAIETGPRLRVGLGDLGMSLCVAGAVEVAPRGVALDDGGQRVVALSGVGAAGSLGIVTGLP